MLNSILVFLSIWVLKYQMRDPSIGAMGSYPLPDNAVLPNIFGKFRIQSGLFFAIIAVILVAILFYKMVFGYKMRVVGSKSPVRKGLRHQHDGNHRGGTAHRRRSGAHGRHLRDPGKLRSFQMDGQHPSTALTA